MDDRATLGELCALASAAAKARGHELDDWIDPAGDDTTARRATCRRCGRVVYIRVEDGMQGMAGPALREPCRP
jgi:hypothetical protein